MKQQYPLLLKYHWFDDETSIPCPTHPLPISCSRLKSHQTKEQTKKIEVPFLPLRAQYTSTLWQGGGGGGPVHRE